jgi:hypothetical protein
MLHTNIPASYLVFIPFLTVIALLDEELPFVLASNG